MMCYYLNVHFQGQRVNMLTHEAKSNNPANMCRCKYFDIL